MSVSPDEDTGYTDNDEGNEAKEWNRDESKIVYFECITRICVRTSERVVDSKFLECIVIDLEPNPYDAHREDIADDLAIVTVDQP